LSAKTRFIHYHILFWLEIKIQHNKNDHIIVAELRDKDEDPVLFDIVTKTMTPGWCEQGNITSQCMKNSICWKKYPWPFVFEIQTGRVVIMLIIAKTIIMSVRLLLKHKQYMGYSVLSILCRSCNAHINVEYCHSTQALKYICKYINKVSN